MRHISRGLGVWEESGVLVRVWWEGGLLLSWLLNRLLMLLLLKLLLLQLLLSSLMLQQITLKTQQVIVSKNMLQPLLHYIILCYISLAIKNSEIN